MKGKSKECRRKLDSQAVLVEEGGEQSDALTCDLHTTIVIS